MNRAESAAPCKSLHFRTFGLHTETWTSGAQVLRLSRNPPHRRSVHLPPRYRVVLPAQSAGTEAEVWWRGASGGTEARRHKPFANVPEAFARGGTPGRTREGASRACPHPGPSRASGRESRGTPGVSGRAWARPRVPVSGPFPRFRMPAAGARAALPWKLRGPSGGGGGGGGARGGLSRPGARPGAETLSLGLSPGSPAVSEAAC